MEEDKRFTFCRLCLSPSEILTGVFECEEGHTPAGIITELLQLKVSEEDIYPQCVCRKCLGTLKDFKVFKEQCYVFKASIDHAYAARCVSTESASFLMESGGSAVDEEMPTMDLGIRIKIETEMGSNDEEGDVDVETMVNTDGSRVNRETPATDYNGIRIKVEGETDCSDYDTMVWYPEVLTASCDIQSNAFDFMLGSKEDKVSSPAVCKIEVASDEETYMDGEEGTCMERRENAQEGESEGEAEAFEYRCCSECNAEFVTREEMRAHLRTHGDVDESVGKHSRKREPPEYSEGESGLLCSEGSLPRNQLCGGKGGQDFANERRLLTRTEKDDSNCNSKRLKESIVHLRSSTRKERVIDEGNVSEGQVVTRSRKGVMNICGNKSVERYKADKKSVSASNNARVVSVQPLLVHSEVKKSSVVSDDVREVKKSKKTLKKDSKVSVSIPGKGKCIDVGSPDVKPQHSVEFTKDEVICDYCHKGYRLKYELREHIVSCHLSINVHRCSICYTDFSTDSELVLHAALHKSPEKFFCSVCRGNFSSQRQLIDHINESHNTNRGYMCHACFTGFPSQADLGFHQLSHIHEKNFKCPVCGKGYVSSKSLYNHVQSCRRIWSFKCDICGKEFESKHYARLHSSVHDGSKSFSCHLCPKHYSYPTSLSKHIRKVHLKLTRHKCDICGKKFSERHLLVNHYAVHSDDRPFKCGQCENTFKMRKALHRHMRNVHVS